MAEDLNINCLLDNIVTTGLMCFQFNQNNLRITHILSSITNTSLDYNNSNNVADYHVQEITLKGGRF